MKKNVFGRKFSRDTNERKALFKALISSLIISEKIITTEPKAKAIKSDVDKVITKVKKNGESARRLLGGMLNSQALEKLINDVAPRFKNRNGGYTRIIKVGRRFGDNAMEVVMEFTEKPKAVAVQATLVKESKTQNVKSKTTAQKPRVKSKIKKSVKKKE